jgi:hypothetical protein
LPGLLQARLQQIALFLTRINFILLRHQRGLDLIWLSRIVETQQASHLMNDKYQK